MALLVFVSFAIRAFGDEPRYRPNVAESNPSIQRLLSMLVSLASTKSVAVAGGFDDVNQAARTALAAALAVVPALDFTHSVTEQLKSGDVDVSLVPVVPLRRLTPV